MSIFKQVNEFGENVIFTESKMISVRILFGNLSNIIRPIRVVGYKLTKEDNGCGQLITLETYTKTGKELADIGITRYSWMEDEAKCYINEKDDYLDIEIEYNIRSQIQH